MAWRPFPMRGAMLLFDRETGDNVLVEDESTRALVPQAPRAVQFAITNRCNLACTFCSRDVTSASQWTAGEAFAVLADLARAGVLEVAFGGGEPFAFRGFAALVRRLYEETPLAVSATTNGMLLTRETLHEIRGCYGQLRLSIYGPSPAAARPPEEPATLRRTKGYEENAWRETVAMLVGEGARFGVNYLVTPARLADLDTTIVELAALGCRDVLLLSYNGDDRALHLSRAQADELAARVSRLSRALPGVRIGLDVCWGDRLAAVPRLFAKADCGAGSEFVVVTSDKRVMPCSFHHVSFPAATAEEILAVWRDRTGALRAPARLPGCARSVDFGLGS